MITLKWAQVNAWRLSQHGLIHRLQPQELIQVVRQTVGIQAQVMSAAEMAIASRVEGLTPQDVQTALWQEHTLIKTWAMRQTLHLVPSTDLPIYVAARKLTEINWPSLFSRVGINRATYDAYLEIAPQILNEFPMTRQEFAKKVGERLKSPELRDFLINRAWGVPLKPLAWRGELCFGPNLGQTPTFVQPRAWIASWKEIEPESAMQEIVRRYLRVYGPAKPEHFQLWWGTYIGPAKNAFNSIADKTVDVDIEGWQGIALSDSISEIQNMEPTGDVHLLPIFDVFTIGLTRGKNLQTVISLENQKKVYRPQGWISAVVLIDGEIQGTWEYKEMRSTIAVKVRMFNSISNTMKDRFATEAERLGKFLDAPVILEFIQS